MSTLTITPEELAKSAAKFRKELLIMSVIALQSTLKHMSLRTGIRYKETVGEMSGSIEMGPYSETRKNESNVKINGRVLETFFGSVWEQFSPNSVYKSIYGDSIVIGEGLKNVPIAKAVLAFLMKKLSGTLNKNIWGAIRNDSGNTTADLFNGFDTITETEITAGNIAVAKKNLYEFTASIDATNAVDLLKAFYRAATDELQGDGDETVKLKLFMPKSIYNAYVDDYQATVGAVPYNKQFNKTFLEGSNDLCELVALPNKKTSPYLHLSPKTNMLVGVDQESDTEKITIEKHHPFLLDFVAAMFFGCQFESISPERLLVGKLFVAP
ncbi:MAG: hypothetical protein VB054_07955 [Petrimonas sp.]|nr:hypothetical protein [Petrimonas sp.]